MEEAKWFLTFLMDFTETLWALTLNKTTGAVLAPRFSHKFLMSLYADLGQ